MSLAKSLNERGEKLEYGSYPNVGRECVKLYYMQENLMYPNVLSMQKSEGGENPQATVVDLAYLAGLWDGEGYIGINKNLRKGSYRHSKFDLTAVMTLVNTDLNIINKCVQILDYHNISAHLRFQDDGHPKHAVRYNVTISKKSAMKRLLELLIPFLVGKRSRAELMLRFINAGLQRAKLNHAFTDEEILLAEQLKELNRKKSPQRPYVEHLNSEEMVQSSQRCEIN